MLYNEGQILSLDSRFDYITGKRTYGNLLIS